MSDEISFVERCTSIQEYNKPSILYHHHEAYVAKQLKLDSVDELDEFFTRCKRGGNGSKAGAEDWEPNPPPFNIKFNVKHSGDDVLHIHGIQQGRKKSKADR